MEQVVIRILAKIGEYAVEPVCGQICYVFSYKSNMENLDVKIQKLEYKKQLLQRSVYEARRNDEEIFTGVQEWLAKVPGVIEEAKNFQRDEGGANTRFLNVSFPNLVWRHRQSRKAKEMVRSIIREIEDAEGFDRVSYLPTPQSSIRNKGYQEFGSRMSTLRMMMEALRDPNVNMIGLYGMGGVGKTMLAKEVVRKATEEKLFSQAILVTVSQNPDYKSIQQEIAEKLGLQLHEKSLSARADRLRSRLKQEKMVLIIVDDVWKRIDLDDDVGVSFEGDQKQCKILLTSRFYNALKNDVRNENIFEVGKLSGSESLDLFNRTAGDSNGKPEFPDLASQIVKECDGLPLAITVLASALTKQPCHVWENALHELRMSTPNNIEGMHETVYSSVKLSYNYLPSEEAKSLLLLCSLFPEDENIDTGDLLKYALALGLFQGPIPNLNVAKNRMFTLVENLKRSSLLLDSSYDKVWVKLHDVIRDVAIDIASKEKRWYNIRSLDELDEYMRRDHKKFKDAIAISLLSCTNVVEQLSAERLEGPQLQLLLIESSYCQIAHRFLEGLKELRVLYLSDVNLNPLPSSFPFLQNLRTLNLIECRLGNIALIGELKNLEIVDLSGSTVVELGSEIGQLTRLRVLDLEGCENLEVIRPNVLGSLRNLEWLTLSSSFENWEVEGVNGRERRNASLSELKNLPQLSSLLNLTIPDVNVLPKDIFGEKLESYSIVLGRSFISPEIKKNFGTYCSRILSIDLERSSQLDEPGLGNLLGRSHAIELIGLEGMNSVAYELDKEGFPHCKHLRVADNAGILYIVNSVGQTAFLNLEILTLQGLVKLEKIFHGRLAPNSFCNLRQLTVSKCDRLKSVFCFSIGKLLEEIEVRDCEMIEEIVDNDEAINAKIEFPRLRSLQLVKLPQLLHYCSDHQPKSTTNTSSIPLFNEKVEFPDMKELELRSLDSLQIIWDMQLLKKFDNNLTRVTVNDCHNLKSLMPSSLCGSLVHLKWLQIGGCENIREVVSIEESAGQEKLGNIFFPQLESLKLYDLPKLRRFCAGDCIECPLKELDIYNCGKMETFISNSLPSHIDNENEEIESVNKQPLFIKDKVEFPNMEKLELQSLDSLQIIWDMQLLEKIDNNLTRVTVNDCHNLKSLMPSSLCGSLVHLKWLRIGGCKIIREVVSIEESAGQEKLGNIFFPQLEYLKLCNLPKLRRFCAGDCIECPSLKELDIDNCGKMETFISNSLPSHIDNENEEIESVNKQPFFIKDKVEFPNMEELELRLLDSLQIIWDMQLLEKFDNNLTSLTLNGCQNLKSLMPSSLCGSLVHLKCLEIVGCENIREVVSIEESAGQEKLGKIFFPQLESLKLYDLPKLRRFCTGDCIECPSLKELGINYCGKMETFISNSLPSHIDNENEEIESVNKQPLFIKDKVKFPNLEVLKIHKIEVISGIWHGDHGAECDVETEQDEIGFSNLRILLLHDLCSLGMFYSGNNIIRLPNLEKLTVIKCPEMRTFSPGTVYTPRLYRIAIKIKHDLSPGFWLYMHFEPAYAADLEYQELLEGDVNTTLQKLWEDHQAAATSS